jgi:hypothetical protein
MIVVVGFPHELITKIFLAKVNNNTFLTFWFAHFLETFCGCDFVTKFVCRIKKSYLKIYHMVFSLNNSKDNSHCLIAPKHFLKNKSKSNYLVSNPNHLIFPLPLHANNLSMKGR